MATVGIELPNVLLERLEQLAAQQGTDVQTLILWAVAERVGALQQMILDRELRKDQDHSQTTTD